MDLSKNIMESCPSHAKNNISPLPQRIWPPNMATTTQMATKHGYHNAYGHQTWLPQRKWLPDTATTTHVATKRAWVMIYHDTYMATKHGWVMIYHNAYMAYMTTKHGRVMIYHNAYGHQTWLGDDLPQHIYGHQTWLGGDLPQCIWPPNMPGWWFTTPHMATKHGWVMITTTHMATKHGWVMIYHNAYGHQTWLGHVAFRDQAAN